VDVVVSMASTCALGGAADGVLGCESPGSIALVSGWDWYAGADPSAIGAGQYDFQTVVEHELGHALGLGEGTDPGSVMYPTLAAGATNRNLLADNLNVTNGDGGACALMAAPPAPGPTADGASGAGPISLAVIVPEGQALRQGAAPVALPVPAHDVTLGPVVGLVAGTPGSTFVSAGLPASSLPAAGGSPAPAWAALLGPVGASPSLPGKWATAGTAEGRWDLVGRVSAPADDLTPAAEEPLPAQPAQDSREPDRAPAVDAEDAGLSALSGGDGGPSALTDDGSGACWGLPVASGAAAEDAGMDPEVFRAAAEAVFDDL
jgi:hypothetical protein